MKNSIKLSIALAITFLSTNLQAATTYSLDGGKKPSSTKTEASLVLQEKDNKVLLNLLNLDLNSVQVKVRDGQGRLIFSETIEDTIVVQKTLNFKEAYKGTYTVKVTDGTIKYSREITII